MHPRAGRLPQRYANIGDVIVASVQEGALPAAVKKGDVSRPLSSAAAVPPLTTAPTSVSTRTPPSSSTEDKNPRGTRIFGPVARELREKDYMKILSLAPEVL